MENSNEILGKDLLDFIFKDRNKGYGAYELRRNYGRRLHKAIWISFGLVAMLLALILYQAKIKKTKKSGDAKVYVMDPVKIHLVEERKKIPEAANKPTAPKPSGKANSKQGKIVFTQSERLPEVKRIPNEALLQVGDIEVPGAISSLAIGIPEGNGGRLGGSELPNETAVALSEQVANVADVMPQYPGGQKALLRFLQKNLKCPETLADDELVKVRIRFVVGYDGKLKGFEVLEDGGDTFNKEVIRVLKRMPDWIPGRTAGNNISVYYSLPVSFMAEE